MFISLTSVSSLDQTGTYSDLVLHARVYSIQLKQLARHTGRRSLANRQLNAKLFSSVLSIVFDARQVTEHMTERNSILDTRTFPPGSRVFPDERHATLHGGSPSS